MKQSVKTIDHSLKYQYPWQSIAFAMLLILSSPFTTEYLVYLAFAICLYRIVKYDERVFAVDYCALATVDMIFRTSGGDAMISYLSIAAVLWYFLRIRIKGDLAAVMLIILVNFLLMRMGTEISKMVLCGSQLILLIILISKQDKESVCRVCLTFCICLVATSFFALLTRNMIPMKLILGRESYAIWGTSLTRFQGLFRDTNYYMSLLIIAIALIIKLRIMRQVHRFTFITIFGSCSFFGFLTYSKTFLLIFAILLCGYIGYQFLKGKYFFGGALIVGVTLFAVISFQSETSFLAVMLSRLQLKNGLDGITTGRSRIFGIYASEIMESFHSLLFGKGMAAPTLYGKDAHNMFLEIAYISGFVGLALFTAYFAALLQKIKKQIPQERPQSFVLKYYVVFVLVLLFCTLHGMFSTVTYVKVFLAIISLGICFNEKTSEKVIPIHDVENEFPRKESLYE